MTDRRECTGKGGRRARQRRRQRLSHFELHTRRRTPWLTCPAVSPTPHEPFFLTRTCRASRKKKSFRYRRNRNGRWKNCGEPGLIPGGSQICFVKRRSGHYRFPAPGRVTHAAKAFYPLPVSLIRDFVIGFLRIPPRGGQPCLDGWFRSSRPMGDFHPLNASHTEHTRRNRLSHT
jgi:hypothetical protein